MTSGSFFKLRFQVSSSFDADEMLGLRRLGFGILKVLSMFPVIVTARWHISKDYRWQKITRPVVWAGEWSGSISNNQVSSKAGGGWVVQ